MHYTRELFNDVIDELEPLIQSHHEEIDWRPDKIPLGVDRQAYTTMEDQGMFVCFTAREGSKLYGYASYFLHNHPHYKTIRYGLNDALYIRPERRGQGIGRELIRFCEEELISLGAQVVTLNIKQVLNWGDLATSEGYEPVEVAWQKWVGD